VFGKPRVVSDSELTSASTARLEGVIHFLPLFIVLNALVIDRAGNEPIELPGIRDPDAPSAV
jgi:hypothetical protein